MYTDIENLLIKLNKKTGLNPTIEIKYTKGRICIKLILLNCKKRSSIKVERELYKLNHDDFDFFRKKIRNLEIKNLYFALLKLYEQDLEK